MIDWTRVMSLKVVEAMYYTVHHSHVHQNTSHLLSLPLVHPSEGEAFSVVQVAIVINQCIVLAKAYQFGPISFSLFPSHVT